MGISSAVVALVLGVLAPAAVLSTASPAQAATSTTRVLTFAYTGGPQNFTVPSGVTSATFDVFGAQGGTKMLGNSGGAGGKGGEAAKAVTVTPGSTYQINVGGSGDSGGWNGGAQGGNDGISSTGFRAGNGGGASDIRTGANGLSDRLLVAGGGGGSGDVGGAGGTGGGATGQAGQNEDNGFPVRGGGGGTASAGGSGGLGTGNAVSGAAGTSGTGGHGADTNSGPALGYSGGGGGGGGWYGGGGGAGCVISGACVGAGGGGGSGFGPAATTFTNGVRAGNGQVVITYVGALLPVVTLVPSQRSAIPGDTVTYTATVAPAPGAPTAIGAGTFAFTDGGNTIAGCGAAAITAGRATCSTTYGLSDAPADHPIVATYSGDTDYLQTSTAVTMPVFRNRVRFGATGTAQTWTVPAGITSARFEARGGQGDKITCITSSAAGGNGAAVIGSLAVTPGATYQINAGGSGASGGWNGGGPKGAAACSGNGGGATDIRTGAYGLADRVMVAGGGGGGAGGAGGAGAQVGVAGGSSQFSGGGGGGGTATAGGAGGSAGGTGSTAGGAGTLGQGGGAGTVTSSGNGAGGGGGGLYGGGGGGGTFGANGGGGGGGSSSGPAGSQFYAGDNAGDGSVAILYQGPNPTTTALTATTRNPLVATANTYTATVTVAAGSLPLAYGTGTVTFTDNGTTITGCAALPLPANGRVTCDETLSAAGGHTISAAYNGDTNFRASSDSLAVNVVANSLTFSSTGAAQTWTVPGGVSSVTFQALGGQGAPGCATGGLGGSATTTLSVSPGQVFNLYVGGQGNGRTAGFNGGGAGGGSPGFPIGSCITPGGGGGASDVRSGGTTFADRIVVGAGGGGGSNVAGAAGGPATGGSAGGASGGRGGTPTAGGAGGSGVWAAGAAGSFGQGGNGGSTSAPGAGGGGGGGGLYGGGGGAADTSGGGGGGGSQLGSDQTGGVRSGNGQVVVSFTPDHTLTVAVAATQVYGSAPIYQPTFTGFVNGDNASSLTGTLSCSFPAGLGSRPLSNCGGLSSNKYFIVYVPGTIVVSAAPLSVSVSGNAVYGAAPTFTRTYSGFVNGDTASAVTGTLTCTTDATATSPVGTGYSVTGCSGLNAANYTISYVLGAVTITSAPLTATVTGTQTYGGSPSYSATFSGLRNGEPPSVVSGTLACSTDATASSPTGAGYHVTGCSGLTAPNYAISYASNGLTVTGAGLTVVVSGTQTFGGSPVFSPGFSGFANGDDSSIVTGTLTCTTDALATSPVGGGYQVSGCHGLSAPNYQITYVDGGLSIVAAPLIATVQGAQTYGGSPVYTATYAGFVGGDDASALTGTLTCTTDATTASTPGMYAITGCSGLSSDNYALTYDLGDVTVTTAPLVVRVTGAQTYGGDPLFVPAYDGFLNGDDASALTGTLTCSTDATPDSPAGTGYHVTGCSGLSSDHYAISYADDGLAVDPAVLTVTGDPQSMSFGDPVPPLTATIDGFVNGDTSTVVTGAPDCSTTADSASVPGPYPITCTAGTLATPNYTFGFVPGVVTVDKRGQTLAFVTPPPSEAAKGVSFTVDAASSSGLPVAIAVSGGCTIVGTKVNMTEKTACTISVDQAGDATTNPATTLTWTVAPK